MNNEPKPQAHRWRAFAVLAVSFFMTVIDNSMTVVNAPDLKPSAV